MGIEIIAVLLVVAAIGLFLIWRTIKFFVRLALIGALILIVLGVAFTWWNRAGTSTVGGRSPANTSKRAPSTSR